MQDGAITGVSPTPIGGNNIHLTTRRGDYFYDAHLSRFATGLVQGQQVVAGQTIGYGGDTGDAKSTPPHLHFENHPDGGPAVDPTMYLDAWRAAGHPVSASPSTQQPPAPRRSDPSPAADDPAIDAAVQQAAEGFAALQDEITSGARPSPGRAARSAPPARRCWSSTPPARCSSSAFTSAPCCCPSGFGDGRAAGRTR